VKVIGTTYVEDEIENDESEKLVITERKMSNIAGIVFCYYCLPFCFLSFTSKDCYILTQKK